MTDRLLMIFTRNPELGKVKTRLAKAIGDQAALDIYTFLLKHTANAAAQVTAAREVHYSVAIRQADLWSEDLFEKRLQQGQDLGQRMAHAFEQGFQKGYQKIVIVGSDLYDLKPTDIEEAFLSLDQHEAVIGPAKDGGYYLLGLTATVPGLFEDKTWGTSAVYQQSMQNLAHLDVHVLAEKNDIDEYEDLAGNPVFDPFLNKDNS